jgi:hypothetical protein
MRFHIGVLKIQFRFCKIKMQISVVLLLNPPKNRRFSITHIVIRSFQRISSSIRQDFRMLAQRKYFSWTLKFLWELWPSVSTEKKCFTNMKCSLKCIEVPISADVKQKNMPMGKTDFPRKTRISEIELNRSSLS